MINVFRSLSWGYRTNRPYYFEEKIIVNTLVRMASEDFTSDRALVLIN
ncbi:DUF4942 domain-containing protein [Edwardsiella tarda]